MVGINKLIGLATLNGLECLWFGSRAGEQDFIQEGVTFTIPNKMMVCGFWNDDLGQVVLSAEVVQKKSSFGVGLTDIEVTPEIEGSSWIGIQDLVDYYGQLGQLIKELTLLTKCWQIYSDVDTES